MPVYNKLPEWGCRTLQQLKKNVQTLGWYRFGFKRNILQCISFIDVLGTAPVMGCPGVCMLLYNDTAKLSTILKQRLSITE
jgi:hypothetical protein